LELGQIFEVLQTSAGDLGAAEVQRLELPQPLEVLQTSVGDLGAAEVQLLELPQPLEVLQTGTGDSGNPEAQLSKSCPISLRRFRPASVTSVLAQVQLLELGADP